MMPLSPSFHSGRLSCSAHQSASCNSGSVHDAASSGAWWLTQGWGAALSERPRYAVTYTGGYDSGTPAPVGLVDAICELAHRYLNPADMSTTPAGATSLGAGGQSVAGRRLGGAASLPPALRAEFLKFRHISGRLP